MSGNGKACPAAIQPTDRNTQQSTLIDRLRKESGFFDLSEHFFACETMSLNNPEHEIIRPTLQEPRVHVALVCAALSCAPIRPEAYARRRLADQLQDQAHQYTNNKKYVHFDPGTNAVLLSPILSWYGEDWNKSAEYLPCLSDRVADDIVRERLQQAATGEVDAAFNKYDDHSIRRPEAPAAVEQAATDLAPAAFPMNNMLQRNLIV